MNLKNKLQEFNKRRKDLKLLKQEYRDLIKKFNLTRAKGENTYAVKRRIQNVRANYEKLKFPYMRNLSY